MSGDTYYLNSELYDAVYSDFTADLEPHLAMMRAAGGPAIELCCGNGRLLLPTLDAGIACDGLDLSGEMLDGLRRKLSERGMAATLFQADMRDFTLPRRYALIVIPFNSFLHNLTQEEQLATLRCCRSHLERGGRLAITIFHPSAAKLIEWAAAEKLFKEVPFAAGRIKIYDHAQDDRVEQIRHVTRRIEFFDADGRRVDEQTTGFDLRYVYKPEMELLLRVAGFSRWECRPLFAEYADPDSAARGRAAQEGDNLLWTAWGSAA